MPLTSTVFNIKSIRAGYLDNVNASKYVLTRIFYPKTLLPELKPFQLKNPIDRLASQIAGNISIGEKVVFSNGKLFRKESEEMISDSPLLDIGKDMGEITVRKPLATYRGMKIFLNEIYFKPDKWGINISDEFNSEQASDIRKQLEFLNKKLHVIPDNSLSLSIAPRNLKRIFFSKNALLDLLLLAGNLAAYLMFKYFDDKYSDILNFTLVPLVVLVSNFSYLWFRLYPVAEFSHRYRQDFLNWSTERGGFNLFKRCVYDQTPSHEYTHFLEDVGEIENDIVTNSALALMQLEFNKKVLKDRRGMKTNFNKGLNADPNILISKIIRFKQKWFEPYRLGSQLGGLAVQLSKRLNDYEARWEFLNIIGRSNNKDILTNLLVSRFKGFFDRLGNKSTL